MKDYSAKTSDVIDAFKQRGFQYIGPTDDGWLKLHGQLRASTTCHVCEIQIDPQFFELPRVRLLKLPESLSRVTPHLGSGGHLCYIAKGTVVLDIFDPVGQSLACLKRAEEVFDKVLKDELVDDLEEEFYAYWNGPLCLIDMQDHRLGRQNTIVIKPGRDFTAIVTDDQVRTTKKIKSLGWEATDYTMLTYRVRTSAKPRPHTSTWPPVTVKDILAWQGLLDTRCRKKIERRIEQGLATAAKGALVLIESPLMTYGFMVFFDHKPYKKGMRYQPRATMYSLKVTPVSVTRIDDRYMAQRNVPGMQTLAGKRIVVIGCGTIGGFLAEMLIKAGAGTSGGLLTLVDFDSLYPQNIGRHRLGFPNLFSNKATGLADELRRLAPGADVRSLPVNVRDAQLGGKLDLLIDATGEESLGHWLCERYLPTTPMLSVWVEGPGTAVRALLRVQNTGACYRCLCGANQKGLFASVVGAVPTLMAGQGCEGLYVPFPASVSVQAASLGAEMVLAWANDAVSPSLRTKLVDTNYQLATADCDPPRMKDCPACPL
jgi:molybdopterin/thiamine biosynthesis adenylyltransferase